MSTFIAGMRLNDRYVLAERIGAGAMSQVWRATDEVLGTPVAVKVLTTGLTGDPNRQGAAWREVHAAARLTHPNVTRVYDCGEAPLLSGAQAPFLVMELVEGESLASRLTAGPLPWPEVARIGACVAAALAAAHELGVVHCDIEPGNIMLTVDNVKVLDFGTSALIGAADQEAVAGTPSYAAPERLERTPAQPASDVYSLGVLLHDALTGGPASALDSWEEAAAAHRAGDTRIVALPDLPPEAGELLRACLSPDSAQRPPARLVATTLAALAGMPDPTASISAEPSTVEMPLPPVTVPAAPSAAPSMASTRVSHRRSALSTLARGRTPWVLAGLAVVVLGLVLAVAVAQSRTGPTGETGPGPAAAPAPPAETSQPPTPSAEPVVPSSEPPAPPSDPPPAPPPAPSSPLVALAEIDQTVRDARGDGLVDRGAAQRLRDRVRDLRKELGKPDQNGQDARVREKVDELEREIDHLERDGELAQPLAAELRTLLAPVDSQA